MSSEGRPRPDGDVPSEPGPPGATERGSIPESSRTDESESFHAAIRCLNDAAIELAAFPPNGALHDFVARKLGQVTAALFVGVSEYDENTDSLVSRAFVGPGEMMSKVLEMTGTGPIGQCFPIADESTREGLWSGRLQPISGGLYELMLRRFPAPICAALEKLLSVGDLFGIGFVWDGRLHGSAVLGLRKGAGINHYVVETFAVQASVALQRAKAAMAQRESEERYRALFESSMDCVYIHDLQGHLLDLNQTALRLLGYSREEALQLRFQDLLSVEQSARASLTANELVTGGRDQRVEVQLRTRTGETRDVETAATFIHRDGRPVAVQGIARDITDRKRAEEELRQHRENLEDLVERRTAELQREIGERTQTEAALRESEERFRLLVDSLADYVYSIDGRGRLTRVNRSLCQALGVEPERAIGRTFGELGVPEEQERQWTDLGRHVLRTGETVTFETRVAHPHGGSRTLEVTLTAIHDAEGAVREIAGISRDITERRLAEAERRRFDAQVQHAQKLESLGVLTGGIAHDFNNLLTAIGGNIQLALTDPAAGAPARECLNDALQASSRAAGLIKQMLAYAGRSQFEVKPVDLRTVVEEMVQMLRVSISRKATLRFDFAPALPLVEADAVQLRQVVMNLVVNAAEALGDNGGGITVSTNVTECDRAALADAGLNEDLPEGRYVQLTVEDTGCGMDPDTRSKIFEPFFTTKFTGRGLGLSAVLGIVRGHQGGINVVSEPGRGTTFTIFLPASSAAPESLGEDVLLPIEWRGQGTVLLVDDELSIQRTGSRMLERLGFSVLTASDGREALKILGDQSREIVCVLLDLVMPVMDGEETFYELRRLRSDVPVLLSSGHDEQEATRRFSGRGLAGFMQKPYSLESLARKMRDALGA